MKIAQIIDSLGWGGAQKLLVTFSEVAIQRNISLTIITLDGDEASAPFRANLEKLGIRVIVFHAPRLLAPLRFFKLTRFLKQEQFDIVHTHLSYANILGSLACTLTNTPIVATIHNVKIDGPSARRRLEYWVLKKWPTN